MPPRHDHPDRRTRAELRADEIDISPTTLLAEIERLTGERDTATRERDEYLAALQRERAEFLNFKRRTADEREAGLGFAAETLIGRILDLADDFDRAIEARPPGADGAAVDPWSEGVIAIDRKLRALLEREGVSPIDAGPGTAFDPRSHEAIASIPGTGQPDGAIVAELRRGYRLRDRVIRPALVAVADAGVPGIGRPGDRRPD
jgi:molecular chaperone GrpE